MIKAVIFDVGGVLHVSAHLDIVKDISKEFNIEYNLAENTYKEFISLLVTGEITEKEFWDKFINKVQFVGDLPKLSLFVRTYSENFKINEEVIKIVRSLKKEKYKLCVLSNTISAHTEYNRKRNIYRDFDYLIFSHEIGLSKPDSRIYDLALKKLKVSASEAVFIDDLEENVRAALTLGINAILFMSADQLKFDLKKLGVNI